MKHEVNIKPPFKWQEHPAVLRQKMEEHRSFVKRAAKLMARPFLIWATILPCVFVFALKSLFPSLELPYTRMLVGPILALPVFFGIQMSEQWLSIRFERAYRADQRRIMRPRLHDKIRFCFYWKACAGFSIEPHEIAPDALALVLHVRHEGSQPVRLTLPNDELLREAVIKLVASHVPLLDPVPTATSDTIR